MEHGRTAQGSHARPMNLRDASDDLISPHPLDTPEELDSSDISAISSTSRTSHDDGSMRSKQANAIFRLPPEVIERILWFVDADTFASAVLLNRQWHTVSEKTELYAHHLSRCPSFALTNNVITGPFRRNDLKRLKSRFAIEVRRNLFEAYLRPRETLVNIICNSANSSAAFPFGEAFQFAFSPNGQTLLALSSSRIYVLDLISDPIVVRRELKTFRRPLSASITDDGSLLAVLSTKHQANIYGLTESGVKHIQVLVLDNPPRNITLAHEGTVLAAAYEGGVEVFSLAANALSTDRRAVRCEAVDSLSFSGDGSMLIGSSLGQDDPSAVIITAPFYTENDPSISNRDLHSRMWTTQILFPNNSSTCSHAALLPAHGEGDGNWLFAFDHTLQSYRAVRTDDTRTGVAYFLSPPISRRYSMPFPTIAPAASASGDLVVAGFSGTGLWLYGIPEKVDTAPDMGSVIERDEQRNHGRLAITSATGNREPLMAYSPSVSGSTESIEDDMLAGKVDWRQSIFVKCRHLKSINGLSAAKWVEKTDAIAAGFQGKRLAVVAPGGVSAFAEEMGDESMPVDGGRISILDFDYAPHQGGNRVFTIEVGQEEADMLPEQHGNLDVEVALERRRTIRATRGRGNRRLSLGRSATAIGAHSVDYSTNIDERLAFNSISQPPSPDDEHSRSPSRSPDSLLRAATSAGITRARYPPRAPLGSNQGTSSGRVIYGRQDGRGEIPHESDADNWVPPPPPYKRSPPVGLPVRSPPADVPVSVPITPPLRHATEPVERTTEAITPPRRASTTMDGMMTSEHAPVEQQVNQYGGPGRIYRPRGMSESSLDTLSELRNHHHSSSGPSQYLARANTGDSIVSPLSMSSGQSSVRRRPISHDGRITSTDSYFSLRATISRPMSTSPPDRIPEQMQQPPPLPQPQVGPVVRAESSPVSSVAESNVTLTGSNLQNRLNHPVPPTPTESEQQIAPRYIPRKLQVGNDSAPAVLPADKDSEPFTLAPPTPDQLAKLHRRVSSGMRRRPVSITANPTREYYAPGGRPESRDFGVVPPSPPRAAWGAAGVPGFVSFHKARNSPQGLSRPTSQQSNSLNHSSSTPNLLSQRPAYDRMDTIESIGSVQTYSEQMRSSRSHSVAQSMGGMAPIGEAGIIHENQRLGVTDARTNNNGISGGRKVKKEKRRKVDREWSDTSQDGSGGKKKGMRCTVM